MKLNNFPGKDIAPTKSGPGTLVTSFPWYNLVGMYYRSMLIVLRRSPVDSGQTNLNASFVEQIDSTMFGTTYSHSIAIGGKKELNKIMAALHLYVVIFLFHPI